jgi:hypothetical protein
MAGKQRQSEESKIIAYFRNQPVEVANMVFGLVKEELKQRQPQSAKKSAGAGSSKAKSKTKDNAVDPRQTEIDKDKYTHVGAGASS